MRLIGTLKGKKKAFQFHSFLKGEKIECCYEPDSGKEETFQFWVTHEEEVDIAIHWFKEFQKNPDDPRFTLKEHPIDTEGVARGKEGVAEEEPLPLRAARFRERVRPKVGVTRFIVLVCAILFLWNWQQVKKYEGSQEKRLTPLMAHLSYDMPSVGSQTVWDGVYGIAVGWPQSKEELEAPMFVQIREGHIWRLITPVFLHGGLLHIFFNMLWLWTLGRQVEERIKKWQYLAITLIIGIVSNTFQYLMSGPLFVGYSGIICGLAGFIWMRQRRAPWEGYPLQKGSLAFLAVFAIGMMVLQLVAFILLRYQIADFAMGLGNTAHISGAIVGAVLGRIPLFSKGSG